MIATRAMLRGRKVRVRQGQVIVILALLMPAMIGMVGVALDLGNIYLHKRLVQNAADFAALAGANDLPEAAGAARTSAVSFAAKNGFQNGVDSTTVTVTTPYDGDSRKVQVVIRQFVPGIFVRVLGLGATPVSGRAVAYRTAAMYAMFAVNGCVSGNSLDVAGGSLTITGNIHSNSDLNIWGSDEDVNGIATYACSSQVTGSNESFTQGPTRTAVRPLPVTYTSSDFQPCTYSGTGTWNLSTSGPWWIDSHHLKPGVYCSTGGIMLNTSNVTGNVTFVAAGQIQVNGSSYDLSPYRRGVLMYSSAGGTALSLNGNSGVWRGMLYAPAGKVAFNGSGSISLSGGIIGGSIAVSGSNWSLSSGGGAAAKSRLVE